MTAGLQSWSTTGNVLQIDESYRNLVLRQKGTVPEGGGSITFLNGVSPVVVLCPIIANAGYCAYISHLNVSGTTYTWTVPAWADYYVFDVPPAPAAHGIGLQVFNAAGQIAYDSGLAPMRVLGVYNHTPADGSPANQSVQIATLPAATKVGFAQSAQAFYREQRMVSGSPWQAVGVEGIYKLDGQTQVWVRKTDIVFVSGSPGISQHFTGVNIAVDVTNL